MKASVGNSVDYSVLVYLLARPYLGYHSVLVYVDALFMLALALAIIRDILPTAMDLLEHYRRKRTKR